MTPAGLARLARRAGHVTDMQDILSLQSRIRTLRPAPRQRPPVPMPPRDMQDILRQQTRVRRLVRAVRVKMLWPSYVCR